MASSLANFHGLEKQTIRHRPPGKLLEGNPSLTALEYVLLTTTAAMGGVLNSVAGGGSFLTFPSLVFVGIPPVNANATSTVALWPGSLAAAIAYRKELAASRKSLLSMSVISVIGGVLGAVLLLHTPNPVFMRVLPFLLLIAALIFTFGARITALLRRTSRHMHSGSPATVVAGTAFQLVIAAYGGYFGGGIGFMMLATFSLMGMTNIHVMNALKTVMATLINLAAIAAFVAAGAIAFKPGLIMVIAATLGGYFGASTARRLDAKWVHRFVLCIAWVMTAYFFWRAHR
jgi:uncharacterized membrane protein YfcA